MTNIECKQRYWKKKFDNAPFIYCGCGCGTLIKSVDHYGREVRFLNGHNKTAYSGEQRTRSAARKRWLDKNPEYLMKAKLRHYRKRKLRVMAMFGNKCLHCGLSYDGKNASNFVFHHRDPKIKDTEITILIRNASFERVLVELAKCDMLCAHCHLTLHNGAW